MPLRQELGKIQSQQNQNKENIFKILPNSPNEQAHPQLQTLRIPLQLRLNSN